MGGCGFESILYTSPLFLKKTHKNNNYFNRLPLQVRFIIVTCNVYIIIFFILMTLLLCIFTQWKNCAYVRNWFQ